MTPREHYEANRAVLDANDVRLQKILEDRAVRDAIQFLIVTHHMAHEASDRNKPQAADNLLQCGCKTFHALYNRLNEADYDRGIAGQAAGMLAVAMVKGSKA